ncbi:MAG: hypothetical protein QG597_1249 [Actinomycetota bacterium]|nr:hypothetical protein [Actinomycetota bacterium]
MGKIAFIDDMPEADEAFVRAHRDELLALAADMGITDVKVASTGRLVGTVTADAVPLGVRVPTLVRGWIRDGMGFGRLKGLPTRASSG